MKRSLSAREIRFLLAGVPPVLAWAIWIALISPMITLKAESLTRIQKADAIADILASSDGTVVANTPRPIQGILTQSAEAANLLIRRMEPSGTAMSVTLDDAPFAIVIAWLASLTQEEGLRISAVEMGRRTAPGTVSTRITLEPAR
ncbi:type II secretion system protein GspM [Roseobacter sp. EG26]|uniref:type II secretion system protein GspM n=1 Tax=Roseobacter sp. EG26 TaxID=3412477 RepID=UPI003CE4FE12